MDVDAVEKGTADALEIAGSGVATAGATGPMRGVRPIAATGAGVHGGHELEVGRKDHRGSGAADRHFTGFERLTEHLQNVAWHLREFVEEQHAMVCQADLAR